MISTFCEMKSVWKTKGGLRAASGQKMLCIMLWGTKHGMVEYGLILFNASPKEHTYNPANRKHYLESAVSEIRLKQRDGVTI